MKSKEIKYGKSSFVGKTGGEFKNDYQIIKEIGRGGFGEVYEVKNKKTGEIRACKHLAKGKIDLERFQTEIQIMKDFDHPNIIKLYEIYDTPDSVWLVMEECKGGEIFDRIVEHMEKQQMYTEKEAANILKQVVSAIEYCHNHGICHRDLKPENLLYLNKGPEKDNPIKVIDFGLSEKKNNLKAKVGSAYYVSPEILNGKYNEKCDIWSAGVILYILLSGEPPFNSPDDESIYEEIKKMKLEFPDNKWKNISKGAKDLLSHMLTKERPRYSARRVLEHSWFKNATDTPISFQNFDASTFQNFVKGSFLKKITLLFIASRLDDNEIITLRKNFEALDKCNDGQLSYDEFKEGIIKVKGKKITENEIQEMFNSIDVDKNGKIDYTEFIAASLKKRTYTKNERLYEVFCSFDKDKNGEITKEDIVQAIKCDKSQEKEIEKYIKAVDRNGDGKISYKEFLEMM